MITGWEEGMIIRRISFMIEASRSAEGDQMTAGKPAPSYQVLLHLSLVTDDGVHWSSEAPYPACQGFIVRKDLASLFFLFFCK